jgi:hypothetical protein
MHLRTAEQIAGPVPFEKVVTIRTASGSEELIVHTSQISSNGIEVGLIAQSGDEVLVELPRETLLGHWRVWVPKSAVG